MVEAVPDVEEVSDSELHTAAGTDVATAPRLTYGAPDRGSVNVIIVGFAMIVLLVVAVVISASRVYLTQRDLVGAADAAAASAAQAVSESAIFTGDFGSELPLDPVAAQARVRDYVAVAELASRFDGFAVVAVAVTGTSVTVTFTATAPMPFASVISSEWSDGYPLQATATARSPFTT